MEIIREKSGPRGVAVEDVIDAAGSKWILPGDAVLAAIGTLVDKRRMLPAPERIRQTVMKMEFIRDGPALVIENTERLLIVADLHFGIEADLAAHGMHFKSHSTERLDRLMKTIDATDPDRLILLGDVKHSIPSLTREEWSRDPGCPRYDPAPHPDPCLPGKPRHRHRTVPRGGRDSSQRREQVIDGVAYLHGHTYPAPDLGGHLIVTGHHHPQVSLHDEVGCSLQSPAYLRATIDVKALGLMNAG